MYNNNVKKKTKKQIFMLQYQTAITYELCTSRYVYIKKIINILFSLLIKLSITSSVKFCMFCINDFSVLHIAKIMSKIVFLQT